MERKTFVWTFRIELIVAGRHCANRVGVNKVGVAGLWTQIITTKGERFIIYAAIITSEMNAIGNGGTEGSGVESGLVRVQKIKEGILFLLVLCIGALLLCFARILDWIDKQAPGWTWVLHPLSPTTVMLRSFFILRPFFVIFDPIRLRSIHSNVILRGLNS